MTALHALTFAHAGRKVAHMTVRCVRERACAIITKAQISAGRVGTGGTDFRHLVLNMNLTESRHRPEKRRVIFARRSQPCRILHYLGEQSRRARPAV